MPRLSQPVSRPVCREGPGDDYGVTSRQGLSATLAPPLAVLPAEGWRPNPWAYFIVNFLPPCTGPPTQYTTSHMYNTHANSLSHDLFGFLL